MSYKQVFRSTSGASIPIPIDLRKFKFGVGLVLTFGTGATGTANVEVTGDPLTQGDGSQVVSSSGPTNWNLHDVLQTKTASANSSLAYPCSAVRLNVVNVAGGTITLSVVQAEG